MASVRSSREAVYASIRSRVLTLELAPGAPLSENELAAELGVSRTPVREGLILLAREGLVHVFPKVGSFVARVEIDRVRDAQFLRESVELGSLRDVPTDPDPVLVAELRDNLRRQEDALTDLEEFFRLDEEFHLGLMRLAGHDRVWPTVVSAKGHLDRARRLGLREQTTAEPFREQHAAILDAVVAGRIDQAVDLLRDHLRAVFADIEAVRRSRPELFATGDPGVPVRRTVAVWG
ncbi:GntR family transcriptional regulator [Cellulomonas fimi]|uniref:GntR family transcriptional regulator n=1 Tax=Cellulomonas sp. RIT-PI-Y TaxID=3035297 RepID=UPI0021D8953E